MGSSLEVKLSNYTSNNPVCNQHKNGWSHLWINIAQLFNFNCVSEQMSLYYDYTKILTANNRRGVEIRVTGNSFGRIDAIKNLSSFDDPRLKIYNKFLSYFMDTGYKNGVNLNGAPYDFRYIPNKNFYRKMKLLIEKTYTKNNNSKVVLIGHSLGGLLFTHFINDQNYKWNDKYIKLFIPISTPWLGTTTALKILIEGENYGMWWTSLKDWTKLLRSYQTGLLLMPSVKKWNKNQTLIYTKNENLTISNMHKIFERLNFKFGYSRWLKIHDFLDNLQMPQVNTLCIHGYGIDTIGQLDYTNTTLFGTSRKIYHSSDGTVDRISLNFCKGWQHDKYYMIYKIFNNSHNGILNNYKLYRLIQSYLQKSIPHKMKKFDMVQRDVTCGFFILKILFYNEMYMGNCCLPLSFPDMTVNRPI
ncbi:hypothetical protein A3Q56_02520 [Intoshia linei]|uniref:Phosphatidylcholine-sterol acyltransferase n=1 Tax=Intoshia linei TaxID=1819745 RepID=A0A177B6H3_9BILA|nr:hypothetical protein A3Q56_02520 [Intoshia linei]